MFSEKRTGTVLSPETPFPEGPRQHGQSSAGRLTATNRKMSCAVRFRFIAFSIPRGSTHGT
jgi:hypothetical protein